ncbi:MAG: hypothetical protein Q7R92_01625 [bacterium]|nr:hypothetical protein [bacterium]
MSDEMPVTPVRLILGSDSDWQAANVIIGVLNAIGIPVRVSIASCHWHSGDGLENFIRGLKEDFIAYIGGMQFAAPGIAETVNKVGWQSHKIILAVPTDKIAKHACEDMPEGTVIFMAGFNSIKLEHGLINSALGIAKLYAWKYPDFRKDLSLYFYNMRNRKLLVEEVELDGSGLIPDPKLNK